MNKHISFFVSCNPQPKERPRFSGKRAYTPQATKDYEELIALSASHAVAMSDYAMPAKEDALMAILHFKRADRRKADADNLLKSTLDACNGILYEDDSQIAAFVVTIERGVTKGHEGVSITIGPYFEELSVIDNLDFNKRFEMLAKKQNPP